MTFTYLIKKNKSRQINGKDQKKNKINGLHHFIFLVKLIKNQKKKVLSIFIYQSYFDLQNKKKFNKVIYLP
jgi:hypothetical protein